MRHSAQPLLAAVPATAAASPISLIDHPSGYLALSSRNQRYAPDAGAGFIAYREQGRHLVTFAGVHAPEAARAPLLDRFLAFAAEQDRRVIAVQLRQDQVELFRSRGFTVNRFGASFALALDGFTLSGTGRMKLRNKIKRARTAGLRVLEVGPDLKRDDATFAQLGAISAAWLSAKRKPELDFMIGELGGPQDSSRRIFIALRGSEILGFITYVPAPGARPGWLHDLTRRRPDAPVGTMELINAVAIERFVGERVPWLHFGFTPFVVPDQAAPGESRLLAFALRMLGRYGSVIYPTRNQVEYKLKWRPGLIEPEYLACAPLSLRGVYDLLRVTRSI